MAVYLQRGSIALPFNDADGIDAVGIDLLADRLDAMAPVPVEYELADLALGARGTGNVAKLFGQLRAFFAADGFKNVFSALCIEHG